MTTYKVVVDGSNIATEGRSLPSLTQLDEAVQAFIEEHPGADVLVIVDSSFPNRIDQKELAIFEAAYAAGEIITPPAGTIGRGDSFILKVADKLGATVFSNDSFQEFHGTYDWLFEKGRLEGGKPIPGYGWVFTPRTPVRGPKSREAVRESKRSIARIGSPEASGPMPIPKTPPPFLLKNETAEAPVENNGEKNGGKDRRKRHGKNRVADAVEIKPAVANVELRVDVEAERKKKKKKRKRKGGGATAEAFVADLPAVNEPLAFINFIAQHLIGSEIDGVVSMYSSHGFYVDAAEARCYVPLSGLATPTPRSAKEVVRRGDSYRWVVTAFESSRRGIELALVGSPAADEFALGSGGTGSGSDGQSETDPVEATDGQTVAKKSGKGRRRSGLSREVAPTDSAVVTGETALIDEGTAKSVGRKATTAKSTTAKSTTAKSGAAKSTTPKSGAAKSSAAKLKVSKASTAKSTVGKSTVGKSRVSKSTVGKSEAATAMSSAAKATTAKATTAKLPSSTSITADPKKSKSAATTSKTATTSTSKARDRVAVEPTELQMALTSAVAKPDAVSKSQKENPAGPARMKPPAAKTSAKPVATKPATSKSVAVESTPSKSAAAKSATAKSVVVESPPSKSAAAKSATSKRVAAKSATSKRVAAKPVTAKASTAKSTVGKSTVAKPVAAKPVVAKPVTAKPVVAKPAVAKPAVAKLAVAEPTRA